MLPSEAKPAEMENGHKSTGTIYASLLLAIVIWACGIEAASASRVQSSQAEDPSVTDDGLVVFEMPMPPVSNQFRSRESGSRLRLETDSCGVLKGFRAGGSFYSASMFSDAFEGMEGDDGDSADAAQFAIERWLSQRSEVSVVGDAIIRQCDSNDLSDGDDVQASLRFSLTQRKANAFTHVRISHRFA